MPTGSSHNRHGGFAVVIYALVIVYTPLVAGAAPKGDKAKKSSPKSSTNVDKFSMVAPEIAGGELLNNLRKPVSFEWNDVPLADAIAQLKAGTKADCSVDEADLKKNNLDPQAKVNGKWKDRPAEDVLGEVLSQAKLDYVVEGEKLAVVSQRSAMLKLVTLTYNVQKLCPNAASLEQLKRAVYRAGPEFEWELAGGFASVEENPTQATLTIKHTWSRHAAIRNAMRKFTADK